MSWRGVLTRCVGVAIVLGLVGGPSVAQAAGRVALVIGNSTYGEIGDLENPRNDAADVGAALERLGFDVTTVLDVDQFGFNQALLDFTRRSIGADMAFVFYAGHGIEVDGVNYMVPVNAKLERDTDVRFAAVSLDDMLAATRGASLRVVILDACRNNPLARTIRRTGSTRSMSRGSFGAVDEETLDDETLVAYAAAAGTTASDGTGDRNSPYTAALLEYLEQPLELSAMFRRVRTRVLETTHRTQRPHEYGSLLRDHYLGGTSGGVTSPVLTELRLRQELAFWESIADSENPADFEAYLAQYAEGEFARLAENRLAALRAGPGDPPSVEPLRDLPSAGLPRMPEAGAVFRDCDECPEMVVQPGGALALGRYEVTVGEYLAFASATGAGAGDCAGGSWRDPGFPQTDRHPVTCVSWYDAQAYASWLSRRTGVPYRLPTAAEWERGALGSRPGCYEDVTGRQGTCPVGHYGANAVGLSDMVGNLYEWTADCAEGDCGQRILRGGSWDDYAAILRPDARSPYRAGFRVVLVGFRVSRALD